MPYYQVFSPQGTLPPAVRSAIATDITHIHCEETGAPASFVHVHYHEIQEGSQYLAGKKDHGIPMVLGMVREGRSIKERQRLIKRISEAVSKSLGKPENELILSISEITSATAMEFGLILPQPGGEPEWFEKNSAVLKGVKGTGL
jgi:phenylpyruvate tautomerase PptA (4-oxalocrotonate tautomerase family)